MTLPVSPESSDVPPDPTRPPRGRFLPSLAAYAVVALVTTAAMFWWFPPWHLDLRAPLNYNGDALQHMVYTKGFIENGWYLHNPSLGAPGEMDMREFPAADALPGVIIKFLGLFTQSPGFVNNLLYLLSFPLAALGAFYACRQMGISYGPAGLAGVLYAFLPYHFWRSTGHLYLSCYFMVPPGALVAWWVATGRLLQRPDGGGAVRCGLATVICAVVSTSGLYYPFFTGLFLATAGVYALLGRRDRHNFFAGISLAALVAAGMVLCILPTLVFLRNHPHPPASQRTPGESEIYGLKLAQIVLPADSHPLAAFRAASNTYRQYAPLVNENGTAALGVLGAAGCLGLLGWMLFRPLARTPAEKGPADAAPPRLRETLNVLSVLNGAGLLYGTIGGVGALFALAVSPQIRSLNRISVFIAFFSLAAVAACFDRWFVRAGRSRAVRAAGWVGLIVLGVLGIMDESPRRVDIAGHKRTIEEFRADQEFFARVQAAVPPGTMNFELPYEAFPEVNPPVATMGGDTEFRAYLQTEGLRWSYGAMKNTPPDLWQQRVAAMPLADGLRVLALDGFGGILLERAGYNDRGAEAEATLRQLLGPPAVERREELFFTMTDYVRTLRAGMTDQQWETESKRVRNMIYARFGTGFSGPESKDEHRWYWCGPEGTVTLLNETGETQRMRLTMQAQTGRNAPARLTMTSASGAHSWTIERKPQELTAILDVAPGDYDIRFTCSGLPIDAPADARVMVWSPIDFKLEDLAPDQPSPTPAESSPTPDPIGQSH